MVLILARLVRRYGVVNISDDYNEMAIQFGYLTLFAAAFPAAPFAALLNNLVEARTDLVKLFKGMQRPHPREAASILQEYRYTYGIKYWYLARNSRSHFLFSNHHQLWYHCVYIN